MVQYFTRLGILNKIELLNYWEFLEWLEVVILIDIKIHL